MRVCCGVQLLPSALPRARAETFGEIPNGSAWSITTEAVPELDETHLVVGRVVQVRPGCWLFCCECGLPTFAWQATIVTT